MQMFEQSSICMTEQATTAAHDKIKARLFQSFLQKVLVLPKANHQLRGRRKFAMSTLGQGGAKRRHRSIGETQRVATPVFNDFF